MSDVAQGPGWWQANDGRWYPPQPSPSTAPAPTVGEPLGVAEPLGVSEPLGSVSFPATTPGAEPSYGWAEPSSGFVTVYRSRTIGLLLILLGLAGIVLGIGLLYHALAINSIAHYPRDETISAWTSMAGVMIAGATTVVIGFVYRRN